MAQRDDDELIELKPVPVVWIAAQLGVIVLASVVLITLWDTIPDPEPANAVAGRFAAALPLALLTPAVFLLIHHQAKHTHESPPRRSVAEVNHARALTNEMLPLVGKLMVALTVLIYGGMTADLLGASVSTPAIIALILLVIVAFVIGTRAAYRRATDAAGTSDRHVYAGMFYFNRDDERMIVDHAMGATLNFARPSAWALIAALLTPALIIGIGVALGNE
ncbi:hypothetical protein EKI50_04435 [Corynebacterium sanguinis]|uniref:hypothetical protein n=1 Tax=Corynebacterium sanguinis TaxID=2594913 RepID=UPI0011A75D63|nr:hypothetical protein [Corynebacterium sanguinis]TVS22993.1 hypothetical protein EKI50_04435 [Corynebacterium sanguinis]